MVYGRALCINHAGAPQTSPKWIEIKLTLLFVWSSAPSLFGSAESEIAVKQNKKKGVRLNYFWRLSRPPYFPTTTSLAMVREHLKCFFFFFCCCFFFFGGIPDAIGRMLGHSAGRCHSCWSGKEREGGLLYNKLGGKKKGKNKKQEHRLLGATLISDPTKSKLFKSHQKH